MPQALRNRSHFGPTRNSNVKVLFGAFFRFWSIYSPIGAKIEKRFEKDLNVRISCRTKAQSIPEGLGHKMALGAKLKKKIRKIFLRSLTSLPQIIERNRSLEEVRRCWWRLSCKGHYCQKTRLSKIALHDKSWAEVVKVEQRLCFRAISLTFTLNFLGGCFKSCLVFDSPKVKITILPHNVNFLLLIWIHI